MLTGSYNWTSSAEESNVELLLNLDDPRDVEQFEWAFETLWSAAGGGNG